MKFHFVWQNLVSSLQSTGLQQQERPQRVTEQGAAAEQGFADGQGAADEEGAIGQGAAAEQSVSDEECAAGQDVTDEECAAAEQCVTDEEGAAAEQCVTDEEGAAAEQCVTDEEGAARQGAAAEQGVTDEQGAATEQGVTDEQGAATEQGVTDEQGAATEQGVAAGRDVTDNEPRPGNYDNVSLPKWMRVMEEKMDKCIQVCTDVLQLFKSKNEVMSSGQTNNVQPTIASAELVFRSGRSIAELQSATEQHLVPTGDSKGVFCDVCCTQDEAEAVLNSDQIIKKCGVFKYDMAAPEKQRFGPSDNLPSDFRSLKRAVTAHFQGSRHQKQSELVERRLEVTRRQAEEENKIARHVLRTGYFCLKRSLPHGLFEEILYLQRENGVNVGDTNHSAGFVRKLRNAIVDALLVKLRDFVQAQPCVALCADKVTIARRTVDVTAIMGVVADAPKDKMIQSLIIAAPVVVDHSGDGLAKELALSLRQVGVVHPDKLSAMCTDGQYHMNGVPSKLLSIMAASDPSREVSPSVPALWDPAHLLELAHKDARGVHAWVSDTVCKMTSVTKRYTHGKGFEDLQEADGEGKSLCPRTWSDTRFAAHAAKSIGVFMHNEQRMRDLLADRTCQNLSDREAQEDLHTLKGKQIDPVVDAPFSSNKQWADP